jgi:hypothetical protein
LGFSDIAVSSDRIFIGIVGKDYRHIFFTAIGAPFRGPAPMDKYYRALHNDGGPNE